MAKTVGFSRKIKLEWFDKTIDLCRKKLKEDEFKEELNHYLSFEIESPTVLRKTREILMRIWYYEENDNIAVFRRDAFLLVDKYHDDRLVVYWSMILIIYPVFADLCKMMGRIAEFNDNIKLSQLKQKLYDEWGERSTLFHSTDKIIATMKELGTITTSTPGNYSIVKHSVNNPELVDYILRVAMFIDKGSYYSFSELNSFGFMFPFDYSVSKEYVLTDNHFTTTHFAGETTISLKD